MDTGLYQDMMFAMTGASLELTRQILGIANENLRVNTATLDMARQRNEQTRQLIEAVNRLTEQIAKGRSEYK